MVSFPNCKINIGLQVTGKRPDGYHDLQSVFFPLAVHDAIEVIGHSAKEIIFSTSGNIVDADTSDNLCVKAYEILKKDFPFLPPVKMHLHKNIPVGAGLGGGSADASCMLKLLNTFFRLNLSTEKIIQYAEALGSDCPFFISNKASYITGRGELMEEISLDLSAYKILVVNPGIHINTGWAFSKINISSSRDLKMKIHLPVETWSKNIFNDFEKPVLEAYPALSKIKDDLYKCGAVYASMSGSGSSFYGIFKTSATPELNFPAHYFCKWV